MKEMKETMAVGMEDPDANSVLVLEDENPIWRSWRFWKCFKEVLLGDGTYVARTGNLLHTLASLDALCCVDKKGILSFPNPTAEKVFFFRNVGADSPRNSPSNLESSDSDEEPEENNRTTLDTEVAIQTHAEVLDLSGEFQGGRIQFDDPDWRRHINSLKPLGLNILLNTCNPATQAHYAQFSSHISAEAMANRFTVPISNRRCLCDLAHLIGFTDEASSIFTLKHQLGTFRHVQPEMLRQRERLARALAYPKLKFPFPHMVAVVLEEATTGSLQLMSQGMADLVLDSCSDYWDGSDLWPLTDSDRKKIVDFYHRTSLTAYCTAFAYRPFGCYISSNLSGVYLELPADLTHAPNSFLLRQRSPTPVSWDIHSIESRMKCVFSQYLSTDSLPSVVERNTLRGKTEEVSDAEGWCRAESQQVFIGMVTMQYQAKSDMVHLIEHLDKACIRFVHFSKENELRSRVFSEKMGLESGWNCHISLMAERTRSESGNSTKSGGAGTHTKAEIPNFNGNSIDGYRNLSLSAPSAINLDETQVKFGENVALLEECNEKSSRKRCKSATCQSSSNDEELVSVHESFADDSSLESTDTPPVGFVDKDNRAKLPRGIEAIRPHLQNVDNVPLLVSLFTDVTSAAVREMVKIMQENGEVVVLLGSSQSSENMPLFMQVDAGIAVEPLYPAVCTELAVFEKPMQGPSPAEVSHTLNSLPCSLAYRRDDAISLFHLIMEARHWMSGARTCMQFWCCCSASLVFLMLGGNMALLPPILSASHLLWFLLVCVPIISMSLIFSPIDPPYVMSNAGWKLNTQINKEIVWYSFWCYGGRFLPSLAVVLACNGWSLSAMCKSCTWVHPTDPQHIFVIQNLTVALLLVYFVCISLSFVHRNEQVWQKSPYHNYPWIISTLGLIGIQIAWCLGMIYSSDVTKRIPLPVWLLGGLWPLVLVSLNELIKHKEIRFNVRYQKRVRLEFGTKLGMNSPF